MPNDKPQTQQTPVAGRDFKKKKLFQLKVDGEWFVCRKVDLIGLMFEGAFPAPMTAAVDNLQDARRSMSKGDTMTALAGLNPEARAFAKEFFRRVAVLSCVSPRVTHSKRESIENPDLLWAGGLSDVDGDDQTREQQGDLTMSAQITIYRSVMGESGVDVLPYDVAEEFRQGQPESPVAPVLHGEDVRAKAVVVDPNASDPNFTETDRIRLTHH